MSFELLSHEVNSKLNTHLVRGRQGSSALKIIELQGTLTLDEVVALAKEEAIVLRQPDRAMFALAPVDDFEVEVELLKNNAEFRAFLKQLSEEKASISLQALRSELGLR